MAITDGQRVRAVESNAAWASKTVDNTLTGKQTLARPASGATVVDVQQELNDQAADIATAQNDITNLQSDVAALEALDTFIYLGAWNANTNSPTLADGDNGNTYGPGATYRVQTAGTQNLGSGSQTFAIGDKLVYNNSGVWEKWDVNDADILLDQLSDVDTTGVLERFVLAKGPTFWEARDPNSVANSAITGANQTIAAVDAISRLIRLTNAGLVSIEGIGFTYNQQKLFLTNETGVAVTILNDTGTAANRILTGTGANFVLQSGQSIFLIYDGTTAKWKVLSKEPFATALIPGLLSIVAQVFGGEKDFANGFATDGNDVATAATITNLVNTGSYTRLTGSTATQLQGIAAPVSVKSKRLILSNVSSAIVTVLHQNAGASASDRIITPDGNSISLSPNFSIELIYDIAQSRWVVVSGGVGSGGGGTYTIPAGNTEGAPQNVTSGGGVSITGGGARTMIFVQGSGGAVEVTANPQIPAGATVGYELLLIGRSDSNTLTLNDGTGLSLNGQVTLGLNDTIGFVWTGSVWLEKTRSI